MIDFVKVGQKITAYRKQAKMTQDDLAAQLFVSRQALSKWELGIGAPSIDSLLAICTIFAISFEELLCLNDDRKVHVDPLDIFKGRDRTWVIQQIIRGTIDVQLADVFYQFSPFERMSLLKAIREKKMTCALTDLYVKLTPTEQRYMHDMMQQGGSHQ